MAQKPERLQRIAYVRLVFLSEKYYDKFSALQTLMVHAGEDNELYLL